MNQYWRFPWSSARFDCEKQSEWKMSTGTRKRLWTWDLIWPLLFHIETWKKLKICYQEKFLFPFLWAMFFSWLEDDSRCSYLGFFEWCRFCSFFFIKYVEFLIEVVTWIENLVLGSDFFFLVIHFKATGALFCNAADIFSNHSLISQKVYSSFHRAKQR